MSARCPSRVGALKHDGALRRPLPRKSDGLIRRDYILNGVLAARPIVKLAAAAALILVPCLIFFALGSLYLWNNPAQPFLGSINGSDESVTVLAAARDWGSRAVRRAGVPLSGNLRCSTADKAAGEATNFSVVCAGTTRHRVPVQLSGRSVSVRDAPNGGWQVLTGRWNLRVGRHLNILPCILSAWEVARPCS
jgi:hypothetical protein